MSKIMPAEGWIVQSPSGVLKTARGLCLVRLQDVHAWLMKRHDLPSASAVARVFGVFISDANSETGMKHGVAKVREILYLTDLSEYAESLSGFAGKHFLDEVVEHVPYVPHHRFDRNTLEALMYSLGLMAGEVWAPHDYDIDLNARLNGYCAERRFPAVAKAREVLGRFAVPFAAAHALWGWGVKVTPVQLVAETTTDKWTPERLKADRAALEAGGSKSPMKTLSANSGIPDRKIRHLIKTASTSTAPANSVFNMAKKVKRQS